MTSKSKQHISFLTPRTSKFSPYKYNKNTETLEDLCQRILENSCVSQVVDKSKCIFAICNDVAVLEVIYDFSILVASVHQVLLRSLYSHCCLVLYELEETVDDIVAFRDSHIPLSLQFTSITRSINEFARVEYKTGFVQLLFIQEKSTRREVCRKISSVYKNLISEEVLQSLEDTKSKDDSEVLGDQQKQQKIEAIKLETEEFRQKELLNDELDEPEVLIPPIAPQDLNLLYSDLAFN